MKDAFRTIELIVRECYGRVIAVLLRQGFALQTAEDSLGTAISRALETWPTNGTPGNPAAWLLTVARRSALDQTRAARRLTSLTEDLTEERTMDEATFLALEPIPDERLRLFFLCAHPAIDRGAQTPLMLQLVLGLNGAAIAQLYMVPEAQVQQRLVRAKRKIRDAGIVPRLPDPPEVADRTEVVLDAIYAAYTYAWDLPTDPEHRDLAAECLRLAATVEELVPNSAEAKGLLALLLISESRRESRRTQNGQFVPLDSQEHVRWNAAMIRQGDAVLQRAAGLRSSGRYQLEAAIQSAHVHRIQDGFPGREVIVQLYDRLLVIAPSTGAVLGRIAALAHTLGPERALVELDSLSNLDHHQPYWALRAHLLSQLTRAEDAAAAAATAAKLATDPSVAEFLHPSHGSR